MRAFFTNMISQLKAPLPLGFPDVPDLIDAVSKHLQGKRKFPRTCQSVICVAATREGRCVGHWPEAARARMRSAAVFRRMAVVAATFRHGRRWRRRSGEVLAGCTMKC
ncbi:unnamed protein product [Triticum turgidum subsp. durum]|uniref:Uncharacterized protein n=1 Tax=Triticum turgidum subsp. durum TaxID=4567 RepID=A0A9R1RFD9_TRITD|nr:unnamed protein product [Triticum turgidum subsp. durum]